MEQSTNQKIRNSGSLASRCLPEFLHGMSAMLKAGLSIDAALKAETGKPWRGDFNKVLNSIHADISQGRPLSEACSKFQEIFDPATMGLIRAGESSGRLAEILEDIAFLIDEKVKLKKKIRMIMIYPSIVLAFAILLAMFLTIFVLPAFAEFFRELGHSLPAPTRLLIDFGDFAGHFGIYIIFAFLALITGLSILKQSIYGKVGLDWLGFNFPGISKLVTVLGAARFARTFGQMIRSGIPIVKAIDLAAGTTGNCIIEQLIIRARAEVEQGNPLSTALAAQKVFPDKLIKMLQVGEQTGRIDEMMENIAKHYDHEVKSALDSFLVLLLPLFILLFGGIVAFVVVAVLAPLFQLPAIINV